MVSRYNRKKDKIIHLAVNACLAPICSVHGCAVTTVEGIGTTRTKLHPVQERLAKAHGSQCGFCTPGIIMSMYSLIRQNPKPKMVDMEIAFQGNLCRCTGYRPIIEGLRTFTEEWEREQIAQGMTSNPDKPDQAMKSTRSDKRIDYAKDDAKVKTERKIVRENGLNGGVVGSKSEMKTNGTVNGFAKGQKEVTECENGGGGDGREVKSVKVKYNGVQGKTKATKVKVNVEVTENGTTGVNGVNGREKEQQGVTSCGLGKKCCRFNSSGCYKDPEEILFSYNEFTPYHPSQEVIFPPELLMDSALDEQTLVIEGPRATWYRPTSFEDVLLIKSKFPGAKIINGNTEVGVEVKFKNFVYPVLVNPIYVNEMTEIVYTEKGIRFGAAVTLNEINDVLKEQIATQPEWKTRIFRAATHIFHWFAGKQIRNVSAIGGNLMTGSPISDMNPVLMAANVDLYLTSVNSTRTIKMDHTFFTGYRRNVVKPEEVLTAILFPYSHENQYFNAYKQAKRRDDDIAIVNCAANVEFEPGTHVIRNIYIAFGGVSPCTSRAMKTREKLIGREWNDEMVEDAFNYLVEEFPLAPNAPGGNIMYRRSLTLSLFFKFYLYVKDLLSKRYREVAPVPNRMLSGIDGFHAKDLKSSQYFQVVPKDQDAVDAVGRTLVHVNAYKQATGEAIYCDDIPRMENELYVTLVLSTKPHAKILKIDTTDALAMPGVHAFFSAKDLDEGCNEIGPIFHDEQVFYSDKVTSQGQVIGAIVADTQILSQRASKRVKIEYEDLSPVIISIEQAIEHDSYIGQRKRIVSGDVDEAFKTCDFVKEGKVKMGGQEHFYLETHCALVVPKEDEIEIFSSSQNAAEIQKLTAHVLNIPCNRVITRVKRIGGGFGGKESRANIVAIPLALVAHRMKRPVRCMLDRDEDMVSSGTRHPFMAEYKVGFNKDGKIVAVKMNMYCNAGYSMDLSCGVLDRALFHAENAYKIPNVEVNGYICRTNMPSNTAFRGFGGPQGMFFVETIIDEVAYTIKKPQEEIRYINMYNQGDITHYNQRLETCTVRQCWEECYRNSDFDKRKAEIEEFNRNNRYKKRGISIIPTKFGIAFTEVSLNQAGALVHIYRDGSVLLSHGGVEIGQGLNTKMIQVASRALGIDASQIFISETATDKVPNASATAASAGSDLNGMAVMNACHKLKKRLEPFKKANPEGTWKDWIAKAYHSRVGLSATGFYMTPELGYSFDTNSGRAFNYYTYGVAVASVEIDCLSGDHQVCPLDGA
ncbi:hypothetical protein RUM44_014036 [Polyplax serrata]|uniref:FAD-binding PCMH-type domain-containing protein n=1 Tax=Polyplax serrata TaxID=468196 RepID=A0ABR1BFU5_POLSC